jgi:uncharacterized protein YbjT (DUF2867 family)
LLTVKRFSLLSTSFLRGDLIMMVILGAAGNTGNAVAAELLAAGEDVTVVGRRAEALAPLVARGALAKTGDIADSAFLRSVFDSAAAAYVLLPYDYGAPDLPADQKSMVDAIVEALDRAAVPRVVALSSLGAHLEREGGVMPGLNYFETRLRGLRGAATVALRAGFFFQNFLGMAGLAKGKGILGGFPIEPDVSIPMVHTGDVGRVAAQWLTRNALAGHTVQPVAGPRNWTLAEAAATLGAAVGKPLSWVRFPDADAKAGMQEMGMSASVADAFVALARAANAGRIWGEFRRDTAATTPTALEYFAWHEFARAYAAA